MPIRRRLVCVPTIYTSVQISRQRYIFFPIPIFKYHILSLSVSIDKSDEGAVHIVKRTMLIKIMRISVYFICVYVQVNTRFSLRDDFTADGRIFHSYTFCYGPFTTMSNVHIYVHLQPPLESYSLFPAVITSKPLNETFDKFSIVVKHILSLHAATSVFHYRFYLEAADSRRGFFFQGAKIRVDLCT